MTELSREDLVEVFEYLDELRESGQTNMNAGPTFIIRDLGWDRKQAFEGFGLWMEVFDGKSSVDDRVDTALNK